MRIPENYLEKTYAGWLGKIIGIRLGAAIEGWTYEKIKEEYGELWDYPVNFQDFAADDDSNGPMFFLRALEQLDDCRKPDAQKVGEALLNYAPFEHGFFWWGGYGISTEHTAYLNLRNGIPAPRSGSIEQNGATIAEQIGGQIFIDTWGLIAPGNPELAAEYARAAASVTHDGNGIYGGIFIAAAISIAYLEHDIRTIINRALSYIPEDCEYTRVVRKVMEFYDANPSDWRACYQYIFENFGYDKYPGNCHIIPNTAVMILSLMYGEGDFGNTINICNMCGWDTDCNVANVGTIMGVRGGLECIDYDKWRKPIHDLLICSSVVGSLNILDLPYCVSYIAKWAYQIAGETMPEPMKTIVEQRIHSCHFEYPGSTHSMRSRADAEDTQITMENSTEQAHTGARSLKCTISNLHAGKSALIFQKTHYEAKDFYDSRYDPMFSPLLYPGQTVCGSVYLAEGKDCQVQLYVRDSHTGELITGKPVMLNAGCWNELSFQIPASDALLDEAGFLFRSQESDTVTVYVDDFYYEGKADYILDLSKEKEEHWNWLHHEISQFSRLKGLTYLENGELHLTCSDFGEAYTGYYNWNDYSCEYTLTPIVGEHHYANFRVQGAIRSYAAGFDGAGKFALLKNQNGYRPLAVVDYPWETGKTYQIQVCLKGEQIQVQVNGENVIDYCDTDHPYLTGSIGFSVHKGSHCKLSKMVVK